MCISWTRKGLTTVYTIYFQYISKINLYMFHAGLLLIIRSYYSVSTAFGICHVDWLLAGSALIL